MNKKRKKDIDRVVNELRSCSSDLSSILQDEEDYRAVMPENLQNSERYESSEIWSYALEDAISNIDDAVQRLEDVD